VISFLGDFSPEESKTALGWADRDRMPWPF
jgi:hypothetical protein